MQKILFSRKLTKQDHWKILKSLLIFTNTTAFLLYAFLRALFISTPIDVTDDLVGLLKTLMVGSFCALAIYSILLAIEVVDHIITQKRLKAIPVLKYMTVAVFTLLVFYLSGCNSSTHVGIHKDGNTGMTTKYKNLEPGSSLLVMNNEVLNHTDIPLGENFILINDGVKGLTVKNGKVSAGCELTIKDKKGTNIFHEADLFKNEDVFLKEKAECLKCTISTGKPMNWDENYDVAVTFWDKYGDGKIENEFSIRMIDIP